MLVSVAGESLSSVVLSDDIHDQVLSTQDTHLITPTISSSDSNNCVDCFEGLLPKFLFAFSYHLKVIQGASSQ